MGGWWSQTDGGETNFVSTGQSVYINEKGETVTDSFQNINGAFVRQTETGKMPANSGFGTGTFVSSMNSTPWVIMASALLITLLVALVALSRRHGAMSGKKTEHERTSQNTTDVTPLYSLNKPKSNRVVATTMWNIDLA